MLEAPTCHGKTSFANMPPKHLLLGLLLKMLPFLADKSFTENDMQIVNIRSFHVVFFFQINCFLQRNAKKILLLNIVFAEFCLTNIVCMPVALWQTLKQMVIP